jgi:hypothetical protein
MISQFIATVLALLPVVTGNIQVYERICTPGLYGQYQADTNALIVCAGLTPDDAELTLAHELIHAVQDAKDGINNATFAPILTESYRGKPDYILDLEFEAWYFEEYLHQLIFHGAQF